jgi:hypothetical protein
MAQTLSRMCTEINFLHAIKSVAMTSFKPKTSKIDHTIDKNHRKIQACNFVIIVSI